MGAENDGSQPARPAKLAAHTEPIPAKRQDYTHPAQPPLRTGPLHTDPGSAQNVVTLRQQIAQSSQSIYPPIHYPLATIPYYFKTRGYERSLIELLLLCQ